MCSIVAHENEFQLLFQKFAFALTLPFPYNGIRWIGPCDVMFSKQSSTYTASHLELFPVPNNYEIILSLLFFAVKISVILK